MTALRLLGPIPRGARPRRGCWLILDRRGRVDRVVDGPSPDALRAALGPRRGEALWQRHAVDLEVTAAELKRWRERAR